MPHDQVGVVSPVFVGRARELAITRAAVDTAIHGESALLVIAGEAGVGKTRLVDETARYAVEHDMQVLTGHCAQLGSDGVPFAPVAEALRELVRRTGRVELDAVLGPARELATRLIPSTDATASDEPLSGSQLMELVLGLLERLSTARPLLFVIEDLHWADRSTLELASFLAHNLRGVQVVLVMTLRSDEIDRRHPLRPLLTAWERTRVVTRVELARFSRDEVRGQLAGILGTEPDPSTVQVVYERSDGNAFLAEEMLSALRAGDPHGLPASLRDVLLDRVDQLSGSAGQVLRVAAVSGLRAVPERLLVAVSGLAASDVLDALRETVDSHLLVVDDSGYGYAFRHTLARDAVYDDMLPGERMRLHSAYAEVLGQEPALLRGTTVSVAASLAFHYYAALDLPRALEASIVAGRESAAGLAPPEAMTHYERAVLLWPRVPEPARPADIDLADILQLAGDAAYLSGNADRAKALFHQAQDELPDTASPERRARAMEGDARAEVAHGHRIEAGALLRAALDLLPKEPTTMLHADILGELASVLYHFPENPELFAVATEAVTAAREVGSGRIEAGALLALGRSHLYGGAYDEAIRCLDRGIEIALGEGEQLAVLRGYANLSDLLEELGRSRDAVALLETAIRYAEQVAMMRGIGTFLIGNLAESLLHLGETDRARALAEGALVNRPEGVFEASNQLILAELGLQSGDYAMAEGALRRAEELLADNRDDQYLTPVANLRAELARATGNPAGACGIVRAALAQGPPVRSPRYLWPLLWTGLRADADAGTAASDFTAVTARTASSTAPQRAYQAMCAAEADRAADGRSADHWAAAVAAWRTVDHAWPLAYSLLRQGGADAADGQRERALSALTEARDIAGRLGARPLLAEIDEVAQRARLAVAPTAAASNDPLARYALTAREREVLLLMAAGRTNPEIARELFISPKTASVHASRILTKLGLTSRVQAAGLVHGMGLAKQTPAPS